MNLNDFDLSKTLKFSPDSGEITLGEKRMLIFSQNSFLLLRHLMFKQLGDNLARSLLMKFGFEHGKGDYEALQGIFSPDSEEDRLALGPLMHSWSGIVRVEPTLMEMDKSTGHFHFKGYWHNSYEAQIHLEQFGKADRPVCHTLCGYGSGWCSSFFGRDLLEIETKCVAAGDAHCEWEIRPIEEWGAEAEYWLGPLRDTSESVHKQLESSREKILAMNVNLEKEVARRTEENKHLVRVLCHDLAGPVEVIRNSLKTSTSSDAAVSAAEHLSETLHHIREMQMVQSGKAALNMETFPVSAILRPLSIVWRSKLREKNIDLAFENATDSDPVITGDPKVLSRHVLGNLISNAIKFSPNGGKIKITVGQENERVMVSIKDSGQGMSAEKIRHLFDTVVPTTTAGTAGEKGSGFGLPIVKQYLDLHGADIKVLSTPHQGTEFRLCFSQ